MRSRRHMALSSGTWYLGSIALIAVLVLAFCVPRLSLAEDVSYSDAAAVESAKTLIAALPADPDAVTEADRSAIEAATAAYDALSTSDQAALDSEILDKEQSYGRWLESAQWGLAAKTETIDDSTTFEDGDYSAYISSTSSMGKSTSERARSWSAVKLVAKGGKLTCVIRCSGKSAFKKMRFAGTDYTATVVDGVPEFTVPMQANTNLKFTVDASDVADSIAYEIEVRIDVSEASSTEVAYAKELATSALSGVKASWTSASKKSVRSAARQLSRVAGKTGVKRVELELFQAELSAAQKGAKTKAKKKTTTAGAGSKSSQVKKKGSGKTTASGAETGAGATSTSGGSSASTSASTATTSADSISSSSSSSSKTSTASSNKSKAKDESAMTKSSKAKTEVTPVEVSSASSSDVSAGGDAGSESASAEPNYPLLLGLVFVLLFVAGMVLRTVVFNRQMGLKGGERQ